MFRRTLNASRAPSVRGPNWKENSFGLRCLPLNHLPEAATTAVLVQGVRLLLGKMCNFVVFITFDDHSERSGRPSPPRKTQTYHEVREKKNPYLTTIIIHNYFLLLFLSVCSQASLPFADVVDAEPSPGAADVLCVAALCFVSGKPILKVRDGASGASRIKFCFFFSRSRVSNENSVLNTFILTGFLLPSAIFLFPFFF